MKKKTLKKQIYKTDKPNRLERENKSLFCGKPIFVAWTNENCLFALERLKRVLNNHTTQDYRPM